jgi:hypothetical protein
VGEGDPEGVEGAAAGRDISDEARFCSAGARNRNFPLHHFVVLEIIEDFSESPVTWAYIAARRRVLV